MVLTVVGNRVVSVGPSPLVFAALRGGGGVVAVLNVVCHVSVTGQRLSKFHLNILATYSYGRAETRRK